MNYLDCHNWVGISIMIFKTNGSMTQPNSITRRKNIVYALMRKQM